MKNIWKFMIVALMAIAMVGCPDPNKGDDEGGKKEKEGTFTSFEGVYSFTGKLSKVSTAWGGSDKAPIFTVMLLDSSALDALASGTETDPKGMPVGSPVYQVKDPKQGLVSDNNVSFFSESNGTWKANYDGICATVTGDDYELFIDGSKLNKLQLFGIGTDFGTAGEKAIVKADDVDLTEYVPCVLALINDNTGDSYVGDFWNARLHKTTKTTKEYPADPKDAPEYVNFNLKITGKVYTGDATEDAVWTVKGLSAREGFSFIVNFWAQTNDSGKSVSGVAKDATLEYNCVDPLTPAGWEMSNSGDNTWPSYIPVDAKYVKKLGDKWIYFNELTDEFTIQ